MWLSKHRNPRNGEAKSKVLIVGIGKSGTTALFCKLKQSMPDHTHCLFEPRSFDQNETGSASHVLVKALISIKYDAGFDSFDYFGGKILLVRDPRDLLISRLLYEPFNIPAFCCDDRMVFAFAERLRQKESDPESVSVLELMKMIDRFKNTNAIRNKLALFGMLLKFHRRHPGYFIYRYEDLVAGQFDTLTRYLGFSLTKELAVVPRELSRITRTRQSGDWENWFLASDIERFRPCFQPIMDCFGYGEDWSLGTRRQIPPQHASDYFLRIAAEKRRECGASPLPSYP